MARTVTFLKLQPEDPRNPQDAQNAHRRDAAPMGDAFMEQILENLNTTPPEEVLRRIASLPDIRRGKVLDIRRQLTQGTYEVADRLDTALDRILEAITAAEVRPKDPVLGARHACCHGRSREQAAPQARMDWTRITGARPRIQSGFYCDPDVGPVILDRRRISIVPDKPRSDGQG